ncbi:MAG: hypothetical protein Q8J62_05145 [Candidatus Cloacimonadaceae bacterium]|nr:hypothetical protein [Candidatus Cloacimonadaceae bacterium]
MKKLYLLLLAALLLIPLNAAVGCDLNDPDKDVKRLFPGSTGYKTYYRSVSKEGGKPLLDKVEKRLGDKFTGLFETMDVPYTLYEIYRGKTSIGYIHGVNQKGRFGGLQVFLVFDTKGTITNMYMQKLSSKNSKNFKAAAFTNQFNGLSIKDFDAYDVVKQKGSGKAANIKNPVANDADFHFIMRGVKKNLVLMELFGSWGSL